MHAYTSHAIVLCTVRCHADKAQAEQVQCIQSPVLQRSAQMLMSVPQTMAAVAKYVQTLLALTTAPVILGTGWMATGTDVTVSNLCWACVHAVTFNRVFGCRIVPCTLCSIITSRSVHYEVEILASEKRTPSACSLHLNPLDIDECAENSDGCEQMCTDTDGSFECSCRDGFRLGSDGRSCDGECTLFV